MSSQSMPLVDALALADAASIDVDQARAALKTLRERVLTLERLVTGRSQAEAVLNLLEEETFNEGAAYRQIVEKSRHAAANGWGVLSEGEKVAAALVLNRADWLAERRYTLAEAIDRVGDGWCRLIPKAARELENDAASMEPPKSKAQEIIETTPPDETIYYAADLVTYGSAPGYRDVSLTFKLRMIGGSGADQVHQASISLRPQDGEEIWRHIREVHHFAWSRHAPLDAKPGEARPSWID